MLVKLKDVHVEFPLGLVKIHFLAVALDSYFQSENRQYMIVLKVLERWEFYHN